MARINIYKAVISSDSILLFLFIVYILTVSIMYKIILLLLLTFVSAFAQHKSNTKMPQQQTMLCLGDSYTIGERVPETDRFPVQLVKMLGERDAIQA